MTFWSDICFLCQPNAVSSMNCLYELNLLRTALIIVSMIVTSLGVVFFLRPRRAIEAQIAFYRNINWEMKPISWEKEIKNTRAIGVLTIICGIILLAIS